MPVNADAEAAVAGEVRPSMPAGTADVASDAADVAATAALAPPSMERLPEAERGTKLDAAAERRPVLP